MKKIQFLLITLLIVINCQSQSVNIKVDLQNFPDKTFYLASYYGDKFQIVDTINSIDGKFTILKENLLPQGVYTIAGAHNNKYFEFLLSEDQQFEIHANFKSIIDSLNVKGCLENQDFVKYLKYSSLKNKQNNSLKKLINITNGQENLEYLKQQNQLFADLKYYRLRQIQNNPKSLLSLLFSMMQDVEIPTKLKRLPKKKYDYYNLHYWDYIDLGDERLLRTPILNSKVNTFFDQVLVQHPDSIIASIDRLFSTNLHPDIYSHLLLKLSLKYEYPKIMGLDKIFVHLADKYIAYDQTALSTSIKNALLERADKIRPLLIGTRAPELVMKDTLNEFQSLNTISNKYTVIIFWDHDCQQCQKELRFLKSIYAMKSFDLEVYAVETTTLINKWKDYISKNDLNWINVNGTQSKSADFHELFDIYSTPTIYILDQEKKIIAKRIGAKNIINFLQNHENSL